MNASLSRFLNPAMQANQRLDATLNEIADGVRELRHITPPPSENSLPKPELPDESNRHEAEPTASPKPSVMVQARPPRKHLGATEAFTELGAAAPSAAHHGAVYPVPALLPAVPDLRPELAAFVSAIKAQHEATTQSFRQVVDLCAQQQEEMQRLHELLRQLSSRLDVQSRRM